MSEVKQVWQWSTFQRSTDSLMNKAYVKACERLVINANISNKQKPRILDVGCGSGLVARFLDSHVRIYEYTGIDLNQEGLNLLQERKKKLINASQIESGIQDITIFEESFVNTFDHIFSNFCLYTIKEPAERSSALKNIKQYLKPDGKFHIALPTSKYSAFNISYQCIKDEIKDRKLARALLLVPYQYLFVLKPIEEKVNSGAFRKFKQEEIEFEFKSAGLVVESIETDYGGCGFHVHGSLKNL